MRVLLVDDAILVREGIARLLTEDGVDVIGQLSDATDLAETVRASSPDAVVLDVRMPPTNTTEGLEAAIALKREHARLGVLVLSQRVETRHAVDLLKSGQTGVGYLLKERISHSSELVDALVRVVSGGVAIDSEVVEAILETPSRSASSTPLTTKEREVLALVAEGLSNERIGQRIGVTPRTVETHIGRIFLKLDLREDPASHRRVLAVLAHLRATPGVRTE